MHDDKRGSLFERAFNASITDMNRVSENEQQPVGRVDGRVARWWGGVRVRASFEHVLEVQRQGARSVPRDDTALHQVCLHRVSLFSDLLLRGTVLLLLIQPCHCSLSLGKFFLRGWSNSGGEYPRETRTWWGYFCYRKILFQGTRPVTRGARQNSYRGSWVDSTST